jgi:hypothetical protein
MLNRLFMPRWMVRQASGPLFSWGPVAGLLALLYFPLTVCIATRKPLWTDELFTLYLARLPDLSTLWQALQTGGDQHPPLFYLIVGTSIRLFGENELGLRLPGIIAYGVMSGCLYALVAYRARPACGYLAALVPMLLGTFSYAYEARGYALVLGFAAIAVLGWQRARSPRKHFLPLAAIALGLAGAVGCHYYAILLLIPLAAAELVRWSVTRRFDLTLWLAGATAFLPLALFAPLIHQASAFSDNFWAEPSPRYFLIYFHDYVGWSGLTPLLIALAACSLYAIQIRTSAYGVPSAGRTPHSSPPRPTERGAGRQTDLRDMPATQGVPASEVALAISLLLVQGIALALAATFTGAFHPRYAIVTVLGLPWLLGLASHALLSRHRLLRVSLLGGLTVWFLLVGVQRLLLEEEKRASMDRLHNQLTRQLNTQLPLVLSGSDDWYKVCHYGEDSLRRRCFYLADPEASRRYLNQDTVDRCGLALRPWFAAKMTRYQPFIAEHREFLLLTDLDPSWTWLPSALLSDGGRMEVVARDRGRLLARVTMDREAAAATSSRTFETLER